MALIIAILGGSSLIAQDICRYWPVQNGDQFLLYARTISKISINQDCFPAQNRHITVYPIETYGCHYHDVVINCIGAGDPRILAKLGAQIIATTDYYDGLVLNHLKSNDYVKYIFISSGAVYGCSLAVAPPTSSQQPLDKLNIDGLDFYSVSKLLAEQRHRQHNSLDIIDLRIFGYFSKHISLATQFFVSQIVTSILSGSKLTVDSQPIYRDFLSPTDLGRLISLLCSSPAMNRAFDGYSTAPLDKSTLLRVMSNELGLQYSILPNLPSPFQPTGSKTYYYSLCRDLQQYDFVPTQSSIETILGEARSIIQEPVLDE